MHIENARRVVIIGMVGLASAIGIGRFALTPLLPLMQSVYGTTLTQGAVLASANYAGYLAGAVLCFTINIQAARSARFGLSAVAMSTIFMSMFSAFAMWLFLRFIAGVASALVLVGVSAWIMNILTEKERAKLSGLVYSGVGLGISVAAALSSVIGALGLSPAAGWLTLGIAALLIAAFASPAVVARANRKGSDFLAPQAALTRQEWILVGSYGAFGFAYIVPATFLPAFARAIVDEPLLYGFVWMVFGLAAACSTLLVARLASATPARSIWICSQLLMLIGVVLPALMFNAIVMGLSALLVGGSFMVITMAGLQEARIVRGADAGKLMAAMTAAFAVAQLAGPLLIQPGDTAAESVQRAAVAAAVLLVISTLLLIRLGRTAQAQQPR